MNTIYFGLSNFKTSTMRLLFIITCFISLNSTIVLGQININIEGDNIDVSGTVQNITIDQAVTAHSMLYFDIINNTGNSIDLIITREILEETIGWSNFLCFGPAPFGICYPANSDLIWSSNAETIIDTAKLSTYVTAPTSGTAQYRYYVSEDGVNFLDSVDIRVNSVANVNTLEFVDLQVYPNPSSASVIIKNNISFKHKLINTSGSVIFQSEDEINQVQFDVTDLPRGLYFLILQTNDNRITKKIQVK